MASFPGPGPYPLSRTIALDQRAHGHEDEITSLALAYAVQCAVDDTLTSPGQKSSYDAYLDLDFHVLAPFLFRVAARQVDDAYDLDDLLTWFSPEHWEETCKLAKIHARAYVGHLQMVRKLPVFGAEAD